MGLSFVMRVVAVLGVMAVQLCGAKAVSPKVKCTPERMRVEVPVSAQTRAVYIAGLRDYPDPACRPRTDGALAVLELDLTDVYRCATTRAVNKQTGKQIYYQTLVVENMDEERDGKKLESRETLHVKCSIMSVRNHTLSKRNVLPAGFQEPPPEELQITSTLTEKAPEPILGVGVRQNGKLVTGELNVSPGTPLQMEIFLDKASAPIYGLLVTHMLVTDTKAQEETIIYNGCSVDPFLFENFNTVDGDFLAAKFRAFKFPESTYVQFKGTVNVCLDKCKGVECSDGQIGYGRRKRAIPTLPADPNKIFEITITSFIKVNYDDDSENFEDIIKNQTKIYKEKKFIVGNQMTDDKRFYQTVNDEPSMMEEKKYMSIFAESTATTCGASLMMLMVFFVLRLVL